MAPIPGISCMGVAGSAIKPRSVTPVANSLTFDGVNPSRFVNLGVADSNRLIVATIVAWDSGKSPVTNVTLGGVSMLEIGSVLTGGASNNLQLRMYYLAYPSGTSATIQASCASGLDDGGLAVYSITGGNSVPALSTTVTDSTSGTTAASINMDVIKGDVIISAVMSGDATTSNTNYTTIGLTEYLDADIRTNEIFVSAYQLIAADEVNRSMSHTPASGTRTICRGVRFR